MRLATWNINSVVVRLPRLLSWLDRVEPDVVCLQEVKSSPKTFPTWEIAEVGYDSVAYTTGRWNGVAILSKVGLTEVRRGLIDEPVYVPEGALLGVPEPRAIAATCGGIRVWSVYVPNGREVGHPHFTYKLQWLEAIRETAAAEIHTGRPLAVLGDFNVAPTDRDVWDIREFDGSTHVTDDERKALASLREGGISEIYPRPLRFDVPFTYWDYRAMAFQKNRGMRIDLAYGDRQFLATLTDAYVDRDARSGKGSSDHAPLIIDTEDRRPLL